MPKKHRTLIVKWVKNNIKIFPKSISKHLLLGNGEPANKNSRREPKGAKRDWKRSQKGAKIGPKFISNQWKIKRGSRMHFGSVLGGPWGVKCCKPPRHWDTFSRPSQNRCRKCIENWCRDAPTMMLQLIHKSKKKENTNANKMEPWKSCQTS